MNDPNDTSDLTEPSTVAEPEAPTDPIQSQESTVEPPEEVGENNEDSQEQDEEEVEEREDRYVVAKIVDMKAYKKEKVIKYKVRWEGFTSASDTWETEETLTEDTSVEEQLRIYKELHKVKLEAEIAKLTAMPRGRKPKRKPTWEYVDLEEEKTKKLPIKGFLSQEQPKDDLTTPRELCETDDFYGETAGAVKGEVKKLFDPTHKNSTTELVLAQMNTNERVTRRQMRTLISNVSSRSNSIGRDSASPSPSMASSSAMVKEATPAVETPTKGRRGRPRKTKTPPQVPKKRTLAEITDLYDDEVTEEVHVDTRKSVECASPFPIGDRPSSVNDAQSQPEKVEEDERMDTSTAEDSPQSVNSDDKKSPDELMQQETEEDLLCGLAIHAGPIDLALIQNGYRNLMLPAIKRLNPNEFRFGRDIVALLSHNDLDPQAFEILFENLQATQLQSIFNWRDSVTGHSILHWVCANLKCDRSHAADRIAHILCSFCTDDPNPATPHHLTRLLDTAGNIPLHIAVEKGQLCRASRLIMHRSSLNIINKKQQTPLTLAYASNHAKMVQLLLQSGADFASLERRELSKNEDLRKKRSMEIITRHSKALRKLFADARKKVLCDFEEVFEYKSSVRTTPLCEGPYLKFQLPHEHYVLPSDDYVYIVSLHVCRFDGSDPSQWSARCWSGLSQQAPPIFNGRDLITEHAHYLNHPMMYFVAPVPGENTLELRISLRELRYDILGCQLVLIRRLPEHHIEMMVPGSSGLEVAPLVGVL